MTLELRFHPEARAELLADVAWYDDPEFGLGGRFGLAVRAAVDAAAQGPDSWAIWPGWDREPVVRSKGVGDFLVPGRLLRTKRLPDSRRRGPHEAPARLLAPASTRALIGSFWASEVERLRMDLSPPGPTRQPPHL